MRIKIVGVGLATFFFGFGAGAALNLYLISINDPLVTTLRASLTFRSAIFGDGLILPIVNMVAAAFLLKNKGLINRGLLSAAILIGIITTAYFHVDQAARGLVNWAMPTPWNWNLLGAWHAAYMLSVSSFMALFYLLALKLVRSKNTFVPTAVVTLGLILFFIILGTDYL